MTIQHKFEIVGPPEELTFLGSMNGKDVYVPQEYAPPIEQVIAQLMLERQTARDDAQNSVIAGARMVEQERRSKTLPIIIAAAFGAFAMLALCVASSAVTL